MGNSSFISMVKSFFTDTLSLHAKRSGTKLDFFPVGRTLAKCRRSARVCARKLFTIDIKTYYFPTASEGDENGFI